LLAKCIGVPCPCCGYLIFEEGPGLYSICEICFWEDDLSQLRFVATSGANRVSLIDAQKNYRPYGASEERLSDYVRQPDDADRRDDAWRVFDSTIDTMESPVSGFDYGQSYPKDRKVYYYWRATAGSSIRSS
jgi:hypothetical protein